jgi:Xaa-Pro aminopeptidase
MMEDDVRLLRTGSLPLLLLLLTAPAAAQIPTSEYAQRRAALAERVGDGVVIAFAASGTEGHPYRYLTGVRGGNGVLVMDVRSGRSSDYIYLTGRDFQAASWDGEVLGPEAATATLGMQGRDLQSLPAALAELFQRQRTLHVLSPYVPHGAVLSPATQRLRQLLEPHGGVEVRSAAGHVSELRAIKSPAELDLIRRAVEITVAAHRDIMRKMRPGLNEFELAALAEYTFLRHGAEGRAFSHIIASGPRATILHYNDNNQFIDDGVLVKMDIGASFEGYAADVTRTIPASGRFSPVQRDAYQIVRDAQAAAEAYARPGAPRAGLTTEANRVLGEGLTRLGLMDAPDATYDCAGPGSSMTECPQLRLWFFHGIGHGIGLNVHDPWRNTLDVGTAFSIEPGIYVRPGVLETLPDTPRNREFAARIRPAFQRYAGIGVRIEDNFIMTPEGLEWISRAPREIAEIEALMAEPWTGPSPRQDSRIDWFRQRR